jgi:hypothetical protein
MVFISAGIGITPMAGMLSHLVKAGSAILAVLRASVTENITAIFHVFEHGVPVDTIEAPSVAIEYARRTSPAAAPGPARRWCPACCTTTARPSTRWPSALRS